MTFRRNRKYSVAFILLFYFLLWFLLFEIILPVNHILPKPSIVIQSLNDLINKYNLIWNYLSTISVIYLSLLIAYLLAKLSVPLLTKPNFLFNIILSLEWFSRYLPGIVIAMLLVVWFPKSDYTTLVFAFFITFTSLVISIKNSLKKLSPEYYLSIKTFGIKDNLITRKVIWKAVQPDLFQHIIKQNIHFWAMVMIFEFINRSAGSGNMLRQILLYKDLSALILSFFIIGSSIFLTTHIISIIKSKFYFWKA